MQRVEESGEGGGSERDARVGGALTRSLLWRFDAMTFINNQK